MRNVIGNTSPYALAFQEIHLMLKLFLWVFWNIINKVCFKENVFRCSSLGLSWLYFFSSVFVRCQKALKKWPTLNSKKELKSIKPFVLFSWRIFAVLSGFAFVMYFYQLCQILCCAIVILFDIVWWTLYCCTIWNIALRLLQYGALYVHCNVLWYGVWQVWSYMCNKWNKTNLISQPIM